MKKPMDNNDMENYHEKVGLSHVWGSINLDGESNEDDSNSYQSNVNLVVSSHMARDILDTFSQLNSDTPARKRFTTPDKNGVFYSLLVKEGDIGYENTSKGVGKKHFPKWAKRLRAVVTKKVSNGKSHFNKTRVTYDLEPVVVKNSKIIWQLKCGCNPITLQGGEMSDRAVGATANDSTKEGLISLYNSGFWFLQNIGSFCDPFDRVEGYYGRPDRFKWDNYHSSILKQGKTEIKQSTYSLYTSDCGTHKQELFDQIVAIYHDTYRSRLGRKVSTFNVCDWLGIDCEIEKTSSGKNGKKKKLYLTKRYADRSLKFRATFQVVNIPVGESKKRCIRFGATLFPRMFKHGIDNKGSFTVSDFIDVSLQSSEGSNLDCWQRHMNYIGKNVSEILKKDIMVENFLSFELGSLANAMNVDKPSIQQVLRAWEQGKLHNGADLKSWDEMASIVGVSRPTIGRAVEYMKEKDLSLKIPYRAYTEIAFNRLSASMTLAEKLKLVSHAEKVGSKNLDTVSTSLQKAGRRDRNIAKRLKKMADKGNNLFVIDYMDAYPINTDSITGIKK